MRTIPIPGPCRSGALGAAPPAPTIGVPSRESRRFFGDGAQAAAFDATVAALAARGARIEAIDFAPFYAVAEMLYAGAWVAERHTVVGPLLARDPDAVHPVIRQIVEPAAGAIKTRPVEAGLRAVLNTPRVSLRPAPGGALAVDAGWTESHIEAVADGSYRVPTATINELLAEASHVLLSRQPLSAATYGIGPKPVPGDGEPVLGQLGDTDGLYVAFTHSGATLALIVGELMAYEMITGQSHPLLAPFSVSRFQ